MASNYFYQQIRRIGLAHLPTVMLLIGYMAYWTELYAFPGRMGVTTPLAWIVFFVFALGSLYVNMRRERGQGGLKLAQELRASPRIDRSMIIVGLILSALIMGVVFYAALLPPHFPQEDDALRYHLSLPRQHLIIGSFFHHVAWDWADLTVLPLDYALAPYCFINEMPNKFAHFIVLLGFLGVVIKLTRRFSGGRWTGAILASLAVLGSHGLGIQFGTAMLDIIICYLFFAALESFLSGKIILGLIEFTFLFWSKAFVPIQLTLIVLIMAGVYTAGRRVFRGAYWNFADQAEPLCERTTRRGTVRYAMIFVLLSAVIAGPFWVKSLCYAGTPLYPFAPGMVRPLFVDVPSESWQRILDASRSLMGFKDGYGHGRSAAVFHWCPDVGRLKSYN